MLYILSSICSITTGIKALSVLSIFALPSTFSSNSRTARIDRLSKKGKDLEDKRTCGVAYLSFPGKIMLFLPGQRSVRADTNNRLRSGMQYGNIENDTAELKNSEGQNRPVSEVEGDAPLPYKFNEL